MTDGSATTTCSTGTTSDGPLAAAEDHPDRRSTPGSASPRPRVTFRRTGSERTGRAAATSSSNTAQSRPSSPASMPTTGGCAGRSSRAFASYGKTSTPPTSVAWWRSASSAPATPRQDALWTDESTGSQCSVPPAQGAPFRGGALPGDGPRVLRRATSAAGPAATHHRVPVPLATCPCGPADLRNSCAERVHSSHASRRNIPLRHCGRLPQTPPRGPPPPSPPSAAVRWFSPLAAASTASSARRRCGAPHAARPKRLGRRVLERG